MEDPVTIQCLERFIVLYYFENYLSSMRLIIDSQRNGLETQAKALIMTSAMQPDTLYFGTL